MPSGMSVVAAATPSVGPTFIAVCWSPPATPASSGGACRTTTAVAVTISAPKPAPSSRNPPPISTVDDPGPSRDSVSTPAVSNTPYNNTLKMAASLNVLHGSM